jgi:hypothetical protein
VLLKIAKSNQPFTLVLIIIIGLIIWYNPLLKYQSLHEASTASMPLYSVLQTILQSHIIFSKLLGFILFLGISFYLNHLNTKYIFISERTYLPSIIYIIIVSITIYNKNFYPTLPATLFFLIAIERLFDTYKDEKLSYNVFDAGLLIGIASLFYFSILFFIVFFWAVLLMIRKFYWREWLYVLMGAAVPYIFLFSFYYLTNRDNEIIFHAIKDNFIVHNNINLSKIQLIAGFYIILLLLLSSQYIIQIFPSKKIFARKSFNLFLIAFLLSLLIYFFIPCVSIELIFIGSIPLSFLISHFFIRPRKSRWIELIFDLLIIILILTQVIKL